MNVAVVQVRSEAFQPDRNRERSIAHCTAAADAGAKVVVLPELTVSGYVLDGDRLAQVAEPLAGPTLEAWSGVAARAGIVVAGGFCERGEDGRLYNSAMLVGPDGLLLHYRKLHLFGRERAIFGAGDKGLGVADTPFGRIGLCVCYDLRFVEVLRALALQGADLAAVPTAWVAGFDKIVRDGDGLIGQARGAMVQANLNQIFVACASQSGTVEGTRFLGSSLVVDPFGAIAAGPLGEDEDNTLLAAFDPRTALAAQHRSPLINPRADRRTDLYGISLGETRL